MERQASWRVPVSGAPDISVYLPWVTATVTGGSVSAKRLRVSNSTPGCLSAKRFKTAWDTRSVREASPRGVAMMWSIFFMGVSFPDATLVYRKRRGSRLAAGFLIPGNVEAGQDGIAQRNSAGGQGGCFDNILIEHLWRTGTKGHTEYIPKKSRAMAERQTANYRRFRELIQKWIDAEIELCRIKLRETDEG
jgi:hypothetical protein